MADQHPTIDRTIASTPRLLIRCVETSDRTAMLAVYGDRDAMRWVGDGEPLSEAECDRWLSVTADNYRRYGYGMFAIELRETGQVIGFCGIVHPGGQPEPEVKYALLRDLWGLGIASEAVAALLGHATSTLGLRGIIATTAPENAASQRVLLKCGLREVEPRHNHDGSIDRVFRLD